MHQNIPKMLNLDQLSQSISQAIASLEYPKQPAGLYEPVEYTLRSGGKRLRPVLCLAACQAVCGHPELACQQAMAVEMFHNFTLIHDDVMDRSDKRRGRPTVYAKWGDVQAILSGDALLTMATQRATDCPQELMPRVLDLFNRTAMEVYEGQQYDMDFENRDDVTVDEYLHMIRLKTSVLLGCAASMGALMGSADDATRSAFYDYGADLGVAFQLRDDWLDTFGDPDVFGKPIGGDIANRKKTWLFITAMNEAPGAMAKALSDSPGRQNLVEAVTEVYDSLDLSARCDKLIEDYCSRAIAALDKADIADDDRRWFADLARKLCSRNV